MGSKAKLPGHVWSKVSSLSAGTVSDAKAEIFNLLAENILGSKAFQLKGEFFYKETSGLDSMKLLKSHYQEYSSNISNSARYVVVCHSAIRCTEIIRELRSLTQKKKVFKAFGKHMKLEEQISTFERMNPEVIVGTPDRLGKLLGKISAEKVCVANIVIEVSTKPTGLLSILECRSALIELIYGNEAVSECLSSSKAKIAII